MNIQECYALLQGDYMDVKERFGVEHLIERFMLKYQTDKSVEQLRSALQEKNLEDAFRAAHTLKGVTANLGFTKMVNLSSQLTELLRPRTSLPDQEVIDQVMEEHQRIIEILKMYERKG